MHSSVLLLQYVIPYYKCLTIPSINTFYIRLYQNFVKKEILLTKQINELQNINFNNYNYAQNKKIIKFDRNEFNDFTIIKVNNVRSE